MTFILAKSPRRTLDWSLPRCRLPFLPMVQTRAYWLFVVLGFCELAALALIGQSTISLKGVAVMCALVIWLGSGSSVAWWLFVVSNAVAFVGALAIVLASASGGSFGAGTEWGDVVAIVGGSGGLLAVLSSGAMRAAVRGGPLFRG